MLKRYLLAPGPTSVPPEALLAMATPVVHHRTPEFSELFRQVGQGSRELFGTSSPVLILAATGSGAMEAAVTNTLSRGDRVVVVEGGKFGERWTEIARAFGLCPVAVEVEWGRPVDPADVTRALDRYPDTKAVLVQHSETSTTVLHPLEEIARATRDRDCLLIVDGITSVGVVDAPMDATGVDVLVTGSQKALMLPPGAALIALSEKAWRAAERADLPRQYFDLTRARRSAEADTTAWTPPISMVYGLKAVYDLVATSGGWDAAYRRQRILAEAARAGVRAAGLELLAPESPSPAATGIRIPDGVDGRGLVRHLRDVMGVTIAGGQGRLEGRILRLGHIGYADTFDVVVGLAAIEMALANSGADIKLGRGPAAAQEVLLDMYR